MATRTESENDTQTASGNGADAATTARVREALGGARTRASEAYSTARERTSAAYESARERASSATRQTAQRVETNPIVAVAGGLAVGAILGAILPRTERELQTLGGVGHKVTDAAREAANTAVETGRQQVNELTSNAMAKVGGAVVQAVVSGEGAQNQ